MTENTSTLTENVLSKYKTECFIETGTLHGAAVKLALKLGFSKIYSIELDENLFNQNTKRFDNEIEQSKVQLINGDSIDKLSEIVHNLKSKSTFWLDAHVDFGPEGKKKCPLYEELSIISNSEIKNHTILIDDLRIFGQHWGLGIELERIKNMILEINPKYQFSLEDGCVPNDILAAYVVE
jgi:hypothetical protein